MEKFFYESRPYAFLLIAVAAFRHASGSGLMIASASVLLAAAICIILWRMKYREVVSGLLDYVKQK